MIPLNNRIFLRRIDAPSPAIAAGFTLPDSAKEKATLCEVVAIPTHPYQSDYGGPAQYCPVSVNDKVLIGKYTSDVKIDGEELVVVRWDELLGVEPAATVHVDTNLSKRSVADVTASGGGPSPEEVLSAWPGYAVGMRSTTVRPVPDIDPPPDPAAEQYAFDFARQLAARNPRETIL